MCSVGYELSKSRADSVSDTALRSSERPVRDTECIEAQTAPGTAQSWRRLAWEGDWVARGLSTLQVDGQVVGQ